MRSIDRRNIWKKLAVIVAVVLLLVGSVGAISIASINETGGDFQDGTVTGDAEIVEDTVTVDDPSSSSVTASNLNTQPLVDDRSGVHLTPNQNVVGIEASVSSAVTPNSDGYVEVYLIDSSGTLIGFSSATPGGSSAQFDESLSSGQTYKLLIDGKDGFYEYATGDSLPKSSSLFDVSQGQLPDGSTTNNMVNFDNITVYSDGGNGQYISDTHTVTDARELTTNFSQVDGNAEIHWERYSSGSWSTINSDFVSSSGEYTVGISDSGSNQYRVTVTFDRSTTGGEIVYQSDLVAFNSTAPTLDAPSPSGDTTVSQSPVELSIDVSDADFDTSQGDDVDLTFYDGDDTELGTDTVSSNATATVEYANPTGGANQWYVEATDSYGNTVTSDTFTFNAPSEVEIRDEETQDLITDSDVTLEFYQQSNNPDNIEEIPVTNSTGDMTGLPADESFIAVADADGYADRRIFIDSLIETQTIYLLNESTERVNIEFEIDDFSGEYQEADTILVIERNINGNWTPIQGDFFGATGRFEATLKKDVRHRMRLVDIESGEERAIGTVTPQSSGVRTITVDADGSVSIAEEFEQIFAQPAVASVPAADTTDFAVEIQEGDTTITSYNIEVTVMNETAERQLATRSGSGTATEAFAFNLSGDAGSTLVATVDYQTDDGESGSVTLSKTIRENYPGAEGLLGGLTTIGDVLSDDSGGASGASMFAAVFLSLLVTGAVARVSTSVESIGISALGSVTGFAILGWIPMSALFAATVAFGAMIVLRRGI